MRAPPVVVTSPAGASAPVWSSALTLADFIGGGVPDNDPSAILNAISEPSPGVIRVTIDAKGVNTDGYREGAMFHLGAAAAWQLGDWTDDGKWGAAIVVKQVVPPGTLDGPWVGIGMYDSGVVTSGVYAGLGWATRCGPRVGTATTGDLGGTVVGTVTGAGTIELSNGATTDLGWFQARMAGYSAAGNFLSYDWSYQAAAPVSAAGTIRLFLAVGWNDGTPSPAGTLRTFDFSAYWHPFQWRPALP